MLVRALFLCLLGVLFSCRPAPFRSEKLTVKEAQAIPSADESLSLKERLDSSFAERYRSKYSPSFALINGYYRLPESKPYGAATVVQSYSYQTYFEGLTVTKTQRDYAVTPIDGDDAVSKNKAFNELLDAGVKIKEIAMSDALTIAEAEKKADASHKAAFFGTALPPNVDYLISVYPSSSARGPVLIGRVIKRDGTLMAFRVMYRGGNTDLIGSLIMTLVEDTVRRI